LLLLPSDLMSRVALFEKNFKDIKVWDGDLMVLLVLLLLPFGSSPF
jgi:hypothetical protein